jgi:PmbA protein
MTDSDTDYAGRLELLVETCLKAGADAVDARLGLSEGVSVEVREGVLESIERAEDRDIALRCFFGQRQAHVAGSDLSSESLRALGERCVAMARAVPEDPYCGLPVADELADPEAGPDLDLAGDGEIAEPVLKADAIAAEQAARAVDGVTTISSCGADWSRSRRWLAASNGFRAYSEGSMNGLGLAAVGERDGRMERDYEARNSRYRADRPGPEEIGRIAGERTAARLDPRRISTRDL